MTAVAVRAVGADGEGRAAFDALPVDVYAGDPNWAPGSAEVAQQCFADAEAGLIRMHPVIASRSGRALARAAAIIDPAAADAHGGQQGWIGLVECRAGEQDAGVAAVSECRRWLDGAGAESLVVPRSSGLMAGLLVGGFDKPQTYQTAHNPPWYAAMLHAAGLRTITTMRAFEFTRALAPAFWPRRARGFVIRSADPARIPADLAAVAGLQDVVFAGRSGHLHRSPRQLGLLLERLGPALDPDLVVLAEDHAGRTIGVLVCLVDVWQRRAPGIAPDRARLLSAGVVAEWRGRGVAVAMGRALAGTLLDKGYQSLEASWVLAGNTRPRAVVRALGGRATRRFALLG